MKREKIEIRRENGQKQRDGGGVGEGYKKQVDGGSTEGENE